MSKVYIIEESESLIKHEKEVVKIVSYTEPGWIMGVYKTRKLAEKALANLVEKQPLKEGAFNIQGNENYYEYSYWVDNDCKYEVKHLFAIYKHKVKEEVA